MPGEKLTMNVTPSEFSNIRLAADRMLVADFARFMHNWYGCKFYHEYELKVRTDVPQIPWLSANVERFER